MTAGERLSRGVGPRTYRVRHTTCYEYEVPVVHAHHYAHLEPRPLGSQRVLASELAVSPSAAVVRRSSDYFGNIVHFVEILRSHEQLEITATSRVELSGRDVERAFELSTSWNDVAESIRSNLALTGIREYSFDSPLVRAHPALARYAKPSFAEGRSLVDALREFNRRIHEEFTYEPAVTDVSTPLGRVLRERRGVCQDFAHLAVGCLRSLGLAARYVSGYLETDPPAGAEKLVGADASHAWASLYLPEYGWLDFDPTNGALPDRRHVTVAWGRDFSDVSPLRGVVLGGGRHGLKVAVDVDELASGTISDERALSARSP
jgi:transglutaminase-like putative cysteine protease